MAEWQPRRISADEGAALGLSPFEPRRISAEQAPDFGLPGPEDRTVWGQLSEIPGGMAVGAVGDIGGSALRGAEAVRFPWRDTYVDLLDRVERADVTGARVQDLLPRFEAQPSPLDAITGPGPRRRAEPASELASLDETIRTQLPSEQAGILRNALRERIRRKGKGQPGGAPDPIAEARAAIPPEITERPLYQAGEAVSEAVERAFPGAPGYHDSLGRTLGRGLGSVAAGVAVGLASGPAAPVTLGALFGAAGAGEAADRAIGEGAGDAAASTAARLGVLAGSTDIVPIEILLRRMPAPARRAVEAVAQRVGGERVAAFAGRVGLQTVVEAVQEGGQQTLQNLIAREVYKPEQELGEGVVPSAALGGGVGAIAALGREGVVALASRRSSSRTGDRARAVMQVPPPSPADEASPIPTTDIQAGREVVADAMAVETANRSLETAGMTPIGQPVRLNDGTGRTVEGVVTDAETGQDGSVLGVTVSVQDARFGPDPLEIDMTLDELAERGVTLEGMPMPPSAEELAAQDETAAQDRQKAAEEDQREAEKRNRELEKLEQQIQKRAEDERKRYEELTRQPQPQPTGESAEPARAYGVDESGTVRSAVGPEGKAVLGALAGGAPTMDASQLGGALAGMSGTPDGDAMLRALAGAERTPQGDMVMRALAGQGPQMNAEHLGLALSGMAGSPDGAAMMAAMAGGSPTAAVAPGALAGGTPTADVSAGAMAGRGPEASIPAGAMAGGSPTLELSPAAMAGGGPEASTTPAALAGASPTAAIPPAAMAGASPTPEIAPAALAGGSPTPEIAPGAMAGDSPTPSIEPAALAGESPTAQGGDVGRALAGEPEIILKADGTPFKTDKSAMLSARNKGMTDVGAVQVEGGWALRRAEPPARDGRHPPSLTPLPETRAETFTPDGESAVETELAVVDAADLVVSHDESGQPDPRYPAELQPRERGRATSQLQIRRMAGRLNPALLGESATTDTGAPIVGPDGAVESGNGRAAAIRLAYREGLGNDYRAMVEREAARTGADVAGMEAPVLVRVRQGEGDRTAFARASNVSATARMSASERAKADVETAGRDVLEEYARDPVRAVGRFVETLPATEQGAMVDADGRPSKELRDRVRNAVLWQAYESDGILRAAAESEDPDGKQLLNALTVAAPQFAEVEDGVKTAVNAAVDRIAAARASGMNNKQVLEQVVGQQELIPDETFDDGARTVAQALMERARSGKRMSEYLTELGSRAARAEESRSQGGVDLFGAVPEVDVVEVARQADDATRAPVEVQGALLQRAPDDPGTIDPFALDAADEAGLVRAGETDAQVRSWQTFDETAPRPRAPQRRGREPARDPYTRDAFDPQASLFQRPSGAAARIRLQRRFTAQQGRVAGDIQRIGKEVFGEGFHVQLAQSIEAPDGAQAHGAYDPANRIAYIALRADEAGMTGSLYHEGLHHLRNAGAFTDAQGADTGPWKTLEREAVNTWRKQYGIEERYGPDTEGMDAAQRERLMNEEAIAEALADFQTRGKETGFGPTVRSALNRLMNFFRRMANGLRGRGFATAQDIFEQDIATGEAGRRADAGPDSDGASEEVLLQRGGGTRPPIKWDTSSPSWEATARLSDGSVLTASLTGEGQSRPSGAKEWIPDGYRTLRWTTGDPTEFGTSQTRRPKGSAFSAQEAFGVLGAMLRGLKDTGYRGDIKFDAERKRERIYRRMIPAFGWRMVGVEKGKGEGETDRFRIAPDDDIEIPGAQLQREPSAERDPKDFDDAASKWAGVDLRGAADAVVADKDRMGGFAENVRAQLKGTESVRAPGVEVVDKPTQADLAAWRRFFEPPSSWSKKFPAINALVKSGIQAEIDQSNRIQRLNKDWDRASKKLSRDEFADLTGVMFLGDAEAVTFTDDDLAQMPITDKVRRAYRASRKLLDKVGRFVEQHRRSMALPLLSQRTKLIRQMAGARNMDKSAFRKLYTERANLIAEQRSGTADPETIGARIDALTEKLHGTQPPSEQYAEWAAEADRIQPRIDETKIRHREGYVPHKFFGRWRIFEKVPESDAIVQKGFNDQPFRTEKAARDAAAAAGGGEVLEIEGGYGFKSQWKHVAGEHGFWPSRKDAVRAASKLSRRGAELRVAPVEFTFPEEQATQLSDAAYYRFMNNVEQMVGLEGQDLQDAVRGVARKRFRRRIAGFAQYRKGAQGFSKNLDRVIRTHIGETVRYVSLDKLKFDAINLMEREGLSENRTTVQSRPVLAAAVQQWFKDVNGQKQVLEGQIDQLLNRNWVTPLRGGLAAGAMAYVASGATANPISPVIGAYIGWRVGRGLNQGGPFPTRAITSGMLGDMSHLKLGMTLNVMSALVNTTQITLNTLPVLGTRATSVGFKRFNKAVLSKIRGKPNADWRLMERHDIHPLNTFAEGTRHQFQGEGKLSKISMAFFSSAEGLNRGVTFLGAVSKATGEGKSTGEAHQFAREAMRRTQFHYGAADKPELYRNVLLRVPAQFKNYVSQQIAFAFGLDPKKELPMFLMSLALLTGALGLPLLDLIDDITDQVADFSPIAMMKEEALKALARSELEGGIATFILRGAPGLAGVDMTGRAGMGDKFLPLTLRDWEGPWISTIKNAVRHGAEGASIEDHIRNVTPGFGNPLKVLEAQRNGGVMTSVWKRGRGEYEMTPDEMALKALGARPVREARQQDLRDIERRKIEKRRQDVRRYVDRYVKARQAGDTDEMRHILAEAREQGVPLSRASIQSASRAMLLDRQTRSLKQLPRDMRREGARLREAIDQAAAP